MSIRKQARWKIRALTLSTILLIAVAVVGYLQARDPEDAGRRYLRSSGGAVLFDHIAHSERAGECERCHHELVTGDVVDCNDCHDDPEYDRDLADHDELLEYHAAACADCHDTADAANALGCRSCHPTSAIEGKAVLGCDTCHDDPEFTRDLLDHDELVEIEDHECDGCHTPSPVSTVYHAACSACHLAEAPDRFADDGGKTLCTSCHLK